MQEEQSIKSYSFERKTHRTGETTEGRSVREERIGSVEQTILKDQRLRIQ